MAIPTTEKPDTSLHGPNLILDVENFGPIAEAKNIEFKPMTVFVGPSNTGKTYLAMLMHALLRARHEAVPPQSNLDPIRELGFSYIETESLQRFTVNLQEIISKLEPSSTRFPENATLHIGIGSFAKDSRDFLHRFVNETIRMTAARFEIFIQRYFEIESLQALSNRSSRRFHHPSISWSDTTKRLRLSLDENLASFEVADTFFGIGSDLETTLRHHPVDEVPEIYREVLKSVTNYTLTVLDHLVYSHYVPTGRSGIMNSRHLLAAQLTARDQDYYLLARDFLSSLVAIRGIRSKPVFSSRRFTPVKFSFGTNMNIERVASVIEDSVLKGRIGVEETEGITEFFFVEGQNRLPTTSASSMVTDLAPLVLFIRHFAQIGDLLIIDEPEAHLHPEAQQQMAAALAFMVRSGLRVLITTHSHYMVEQLSAFVNASKLDETARKQALSLEGALGEEDIYLNEDETAVYSFGFSEEHGGSVVKEIFMGEEYEYGPDDHSDATVRQFNRLQRVLEARETAESNGMD